MASGLCKDCEHWQPLNPEEESTERRDFGESWGRCKLTGRYDYRPGDTLALSSDYGTLVTAPDFGCVQFEAKDA